MSEEMDLVHDVASDTRDAGDEELMDDQDVCADEAVDDGDYIERDVLDDEDNISQRKAPTTDVFEAFEFAGQELDKSDDLSQDSSDLCPVCDWSDGQKICSAPMDYNRRFIAVNYPGIIQNKDKALATLGGKQMVEKTLSRDIRMEISFRPSDPFCKSALSTVCQTNGLLIKVKKRVAPSGSKTDSTSDGFEYKIEVLGIIEKSFSFTSACDFQFLPVVKEPGGQFKEILSSIIPTMQDQRDEYLSRSTVPFLPPLVFSRREFPVPYFMEDDVKMNTKLTSLSNRKPRSKGTAMFGFEDKDIPTKALDKPLKTLDKIFTSSFSTEGITNLRKLFEERPLWSKAACEGNIPESQHSCLKYLLPVVAYHFISGPWSRLWCRFGYDPRKHPEAKKFQSVDFRIRSAHFRTKVERKRSMEFRILQNFRPSNSTQRTSLEKNKPNETSCQEQAEKLDLRYMYVRDRVPPYRQMAYQICDIYVPEVQEKMHENDGQETECTERDGWCVPDFTDIARDIMSTYVEKLLVEENQT